MRPTLTMAVHPMDGVNPRLVERIRQAAQIMVEKNTARGDCWRAVGVAGGFVELHTCYNRLRTLLWDRPLHLDDPEWMADVENALQDMRNFTVLIELSLEARLATGDQAVEEQLVCPHCNASVLALPDSKGHSSPR